MEEQTKKILSIQQRKKLIEMNKKKQEQLSIRHIEREKGENIFPASFAQRRVWFIHQMKPDSIEYNVPVAYIIKGEFNLVYCKKALNQLLIRHEILRTTFREVDGEPMQIVHPVQDASLEFLDFSHIEEGEQKENIITQEVKRVTDSIFDLVKGPLIKFLVVKQSQEQHILAIVAHHSIIDSWSLDIFKKEFDKLYEAKCNQNGCVDLPELPVQYGDYALWQKQDMNQDKQEKQLDYWVSKLKDKIENIELPIDFIRPPIRTANGDNYSFDLSEELTHKMKEFAKENQCTVFMVLLAVFQVLLYRYTNREQIVVGTTVASRPTVETESLIGFFINNLSFNTYIADVPSFREYLMRVKEETLEMYQYQEVPFEKVIERLNIPRDLSRTAIFQVMFNYLSAAGDTLKMSGLESEMYPLGGSKATTDLNLFAWEENGFIHFNFEYSRDLFKTSTIRRMATHYMLLIHEILRDTEVAINKISFLSPEEIATYSFDEEKLSAHIETKLTMHRLFEEQVEKAPEAIALRYEEKQISYRLLNEKANQVAHYLLSLGVEPEDRIGLFMDRSIEMVIGMLGVLKAGGAYVPIDITYPQERVERMIKESKAKHVLTQRYLLASFPVLEEVQLLCIDTLGQGETYSKENPLPTHMNDSLMYVLFTSGSTGEPKGVMINHSNYISYINAIIKRLGINEPLQFAIVTTFAADLGSTNIYVPLLTGGCVNIISYEKATDSNQLASYFKEHPIDVMKLVPSHFEALQVGDTPELIIPRKIIIFAGETLTKQTVQKVWESNPKCKIFNNYGPTETTVSVLAYEVQKEKDEGIISIPLGKPLENGYVYVLDKEKQLVPFGVEGELYIGGKGVSRGYLDREDLTKQPFIIDPFDIKQKRKLYKSGDIVRYLENGNIEFVGRVDRQVKIRGYRVELGAIERALKGHKGIEEAIVQVIKDEGNSNKLIGYVTLNHEQDKVNTAILRKYIKNKLPDYMIPQIIVVLENIPINANGKINYKELPIPIGGERNETYVAPRSELEEYLTKIWSEILGVPKVGIDDNFFDLGGESFKAIKLTRQIGMGISIIDLFKFQTIRELGSRLSGKSEETGRLIRLTPQTEKQIVMNYICFPFAGGSAIVFQPLANELPSNCALYGVHLPGHDFTKREDIGGAIEAIVQECVEEIKQKIQGPISIFAQCVAGALGLALTYELRKQGIQVVTLFEVANFPSPRLPGKLSEWWSKLFPADRWMSNKVYRETLRSLGNADEIINIDEENFIIEGIRHDARESVNYFSRTYYDNEFPKIDIPICCIVGERDRSTEYYEERYHEWERYSDQVSLEVIENTGHFFQKHQPKELCGIITEKVMRQMADKRLTSRKTTEVAQTKLKVIEGRETVKQSELSMRLFFIIMLGQIISILGSNLSSFAVGVWVYGKTGSIGDFSLISVCALLPSVLLAPVAGVVADRYDKKMIMILSDLCAVIGTCFVFIMYSLGQLEVWHICLAVLVSCIGNTFQSPAFLSAIPIIVPKCYLGQANGILQFVWSSGGVMGPLLGAGALYLLGMQGVLLVDFITCFATIGTLLFVKFPNRMFKKREESFIKELSGGWRYIMRRHSFVVMVIFFVVANFLMSLITVLFTPLAIALSTDSQLGVVLGANAAGAVVGAIIMSLWGGTKRRADGMIGFLILTGVSIILMGIRPSALLLGIGLFSFGVSIAFVDTHWQILIQSKVGLELQGRVFSINQMLVSTFRPIAMLLAAPLCEKIFTPFLESNLPISRSIKMIIGSGETSDMGLLLVVVGVVLLIWSIGGFRYKPLRNMEDYLPDTIPGAIIYEDKDKIQETMDQAVS